MAFEFKLPDLGEGLTEGEIVEWLIKEGDPIEEGQVFVKVETDKAVLEIPSPRKGMVLRIGGAEGETVQVGEVILVIGEEGEKPKAATAKTDEAEKRPSMGVVGVLEEAQEGVEEKEERVSAEAIPMRPAKRVEVLAMPAVRRLARELQSRGPDPGAASPRKTSRRPQKGRRRNLQRRWKRSKRHGNTTCTATWRGCRFVGCERRLLAQW
jgi:pyruvate dehydrogenase E2 component (dihydrolipoamide acetyltransferase)